MANRRYCRSVVYDAGDYRRVHWFYVRSQLTKKKRHSRKNPTSEVQALLNEKNAGYRLTDLIHANFSTKDYSVTFTFAHPVSPEDASIYFKKFIRKLRDKYKKIGADCRYIYVMEQGSKNGATHFHMIVGGELDRDEIEKIWIEFGELSGYANTRRLQFNENGVEGLAKYMIKNPYVNPNNKIARRWTPSKGLERPKPTKSDSEIKIRDMKYIDANPDDIRYIKKLYPDYSVSEILTTPKPNDPNTPDFGCFVTLLLYKSDTKLFSSKERARNEKR